MSRRTYLPAFCGFLGLNLVGLLVASPAHGQLPTTVQLPSFNTFSYSGSVLVPDSGATALGSIRRSATSSSRRWGQRAYGSSLSHPGASVHVTIIDLDEMDRRIRGLPPVGARSRLGTAPGTLASITAAQANATARRTGKPSVDPDAEGKALVRFARKQYKAGKKSSSHAAYQLAIETLSPQLRALARKEFYRVFPPTASPLPSSAPSLLSR
ncbi:MAG: hypothetical protein AAFU85_02315 [Planctomycetota bacterium]